MNVTMYAYYVNMRKLRGKGKLEAESLESDLVEIVKTLQNGNLKDRKYELRDTKKIVYLDQYEYDINNHTIFMEFKSAEFARPREVINIDTMRKDPKKKKGKKDGEEETTCMILKFDQDRNQGSCIVQSNSYGVSFIKISEYLNAKIQNYHENIKKDKIGYSIYTNNVISKKFLEALESAKRIRAVKLVIDSEQINVSEFKKFSSLNDINQNVEIMLKPAGTGLSIRNNTVKEFYDLYKNPETKIKKIWVDTQQMEGEPLSFDTEKMKQKYMVEVDTTITGEPRVDDLKNALKELIRSY